MYIINIKKQLKLFNISNPCNKETSITDISIIITSMTIHDIILTVYLNRNELNYFMCCYY